MSGILPSVKASTERAAIPMSPKTPTMNCVVRLAYIQALSVGIQFASIARSLAGEEVVEDFVMRRSYLLRGAVEFHFSMMDKAHPVAYFEDCGHVMTDHYHGQAVFLLGLANQSMNRAGPGRIQTGGRLSEHQNV